MAPKPLTGGYLDIPETSLCERSRLSREPGAVQIAPTAEAATTSGVIREAPMAITQRREEVVGAAAGTGNIAH
jgi:hypothetical protein